MNPTQLLILLLQLITMVELSELSGSKKQNPDFNTVKDSNYIQEFVNYSLFIPKLWKANHHSHLSI